MSSRRMANGEWLLAIYPLLTTHCLRYVHISHFYFVASCNFHISNSNRLFLCAESPSPERYYAGYTSTYDFGLLDVLIPIFEKNIGYIVKTISVGSGQAMALGERGEVDVLLVHASEAEKKFVAIGAKAFNEFMVSSEARKIIKKFGLEKFGQPLFFPAAGKKEDDLG